MEQFVELGYSWVATTTHINYKRALKLHDTAIVKTKFISLN